MPSIANKGLHNSAFDLLLVFPCFLIQTLTLTPPPNNANLNMYIRTWYVHYCSEYDVCTEKLNNMPDIKP